MSLYFQFLFNKIYYFEKTTIDNAGHPRTTWSHLFLAAFSQNFVKEVSLHKKRTDIKNFIALSILYLKDS